MMVQSGWRFAVSGGDLAQRSRLIRTGRAAHPIHIRLGGRPIRARGEEDLPTWPAIPRPAGRFPIQGQSGDDSRLTVASGGRSFGMLSYWATALTIASSMPIGSRLGLTDLEVQNQKWRVGSGPPISP